jgi:hypothetical protein
MTPKLRAGEGPYQALHRQHPDWNNQKLKEESHKIIVLKMAVIQKPQVKTASLLAIKSI